MLNLLYQSRSQKETVTTTFRGELIKRDCLQRCGWVQRNMDGAHLEAGNGYHYQPEVSLAGRGHGCEMR
jgi:hypothetical protein